MNKVTLIFSDESPTEIIIHQNKITRKGFFEPCDGKDILEMVKSIIFSDDNTSKRKAIKKNKWNVFIDGILASDKTNDSIVIKIPSDTYYIPFTNGKETLKVFKIILPNIIAIKKLDIISFYWTDVQYKNISLNTTIYPLKMPHTYNDGSVCVGSFKGVLDWNNPSKYFIDLISYPVSHSNEVDKLRLMEEVGYPMEKGKPKKIIYLLQ